MANLIAFDQFVIDEIDLNAYPRNFVAEELVLAANLTIGGITYPDYYWVNGDDGTLDLQLEFLGTGFAVNDAGDFTGGTVNLVAEFDRSTEDPLWLIHGISLPAVAIYNAAFTLSNADEAVLVATALSGNDLIVLSPFADQMNGFGGNDFIRGNGGNDDLDGGAGIDTAAFAGVRSSYTIAQVTSVIFTITGPDGTDTLRNMEFVQFEDQTVQLNPVAGGSAKLYIAPGNLTYGPVPGGDLTQIFGSNQAERITLAGNANAVFDPSFVRGNDAVIIQGNSGSYNISAAVAGITITSNNGAQFRLPSFGTGGGLQLQFNDGTVQLGTDDGGNSFQLAGIAGMQDITGSAAAISSAIMTFA